MSIKGESVMVLPGCSLTLASASQGVVWQAVPMRAGIGFGLRIKTWLFGGFSLLQPFKQLGGPTCPLFKTAAWRLFDFWRYGA